MLPGVDPGREFRKKNTPPSPPLLSSTTYRLYRLYRRLYRLERLSRQGGGGGGGTPPTTTPPILAHVLKARPPKKECMRATKTRPDLRLTMMVIVTIFSIRWKHKKRQTNNLNIALRLFVSLLYDTINIDHHFRKHQKIHTCAHNTSYWLRAILAHFRGTTPKRLLSFEIGQI